MKKILVVVLVVAIALIGATAVFALPGTGHTTTSCATCHTPHWGNSTTFPLWSGLTATSGMGNGYAGTITDLQSLACIYCHDGLGATMTAGYSNVATAANLANGHPVGAAIPAAGQTHTPTDANILATSNAGASVQCRSCHFVHTGSKMVTGSRYVRATTDAVPTIATLCSACHSY